MIRQRHDERSSWGLVNVAQWETVERKAHNMGQFYFDPSRESDPHTLPDAETFHISAKEIESGAWDLWFLTDEEESITNSGWYYWACFPGCLPDGDPIGPFDTEAEALADAREE